MNNISFGDLSINVEIKEKTVNIIWSGQSNDKHPSMKLTPFFDNILKEINNNNEYSVLIDFKNLYYMNSSTIHPLIVFIKTLDELKIKTQIYYDKNSNWQKLSFRAMEKLAIVLKNISVQGI